MDVAANFSVDPSGNSSSKTEGEFPLSVGGATVAQLVEAMDLASIALLIGIVFVIDFPEGEK